jgi:hypothetical protein
LFSPASPPPARAVLAASEKPRPAVNTSPKPRRSEKIILTGVDKRTALGKRIVELRALFLEALGGSDGLSPMKRLKVEQAAQLTALAELCRGDFMRDGAGTLDDLVRLERKADHALRALGIVEAAPKPPTVRDNIASRYPAARLPEATEP